MSLSPLFAQTTGQNPSNVPLQLGLGAAMTVGGIVALARQVTAEPRARERLIKTVKAMPDAATKVPALYALVNSGKAFTADDVVKALYTHHEFGYKLMQYVLGYDQVTNLNLFTNTKRLVKLDTAITASIKHISAPLLSVSQRTENLKELEKLQQLSQTPRFNLQQEIAKTEQILQTALTKRTLPDGLTEEAYFAHHTKLQLLKQLEGKEPQTVARLIETAIDTQNKSLLQATSAVSPNNFQKSSPHGAALVAFADKPKKLGGKAFLSIKPFGRGKITPEALIANGMRDFGKSLGELPEVASVVGRAGVDFAKVNAQAIPSVAGEISRDLSKLPGETAGGLMDVAKTSGVFAKTNLSLIPDAFKFLGNGLKGSPVSAGVFIVGGLTIAGLGIAEFVKNTQKSQK